ncbi:MAG: hypothetical protein LBU04_07570, partial [Christensenellaceae bacterium]|nr:hypothetical protein [Christensenellaceae bacterium]
MNNLKSEFEKWLKTNNKSENMIKGSIIAISETSKWSLSQKIISDDLFCITNDSSYNEISQKLLKNRTFRSKRAKLYKNFKSMKSLYSQFLKTYTDSKENSINEIANSFNESTSNTQILPLVENSSQLKEFTNESTESFKSIQSTEITKAEDSTKCDARKRTIVESIKLVLKGGYVLSAKEIYDEIIKNRLYNFKAKNPYSMVTNALITHCDDINMPSCSSLTKHFAFTYENKKTERKYYLIEYKSVINQTEKIVLNSECDIRCEEKPMSQNKFDWNVGTKTSFSNWLLENGESATTSNSHASNLNTLSSIYNDEFKKARLKATTVDAVEFLNSTLLKSQNHTENEHELRLSFNLFLKYLSNENALQTKATPTIKHNSSSETQTRKVNWNVKESYTSTKPIEMTFKKQPSTEPNSWRVLLQDVCNALLAEYPHVDINQYMNTQGVKRKLFSKTKDAAIDADCYKELKNNYYMFTRYAADSAIKLIKMLFNYYKNDLKIESADLSELNVTLIVLADKSVEKNKINKQNNQIVKTKQSKSRSRSTINSITNKVLENIKKSYPNGFMFDKASIMGLSQESGVEISGRIQRVLKKQMFYNSGSYFLLEQIAGETTRNEILQVSNDFIDKFECFDISMLYSLFEK